MLTNISTLRYKGPPSLLVVIYLVENNHLARKHVSAFEFSSEIRLLVLQPGNHTDELQGVLIHAELALCPWGHIIGFEPDYLSCDMTKARPYEAPWGARRLHCLSQEKGYLLLRTVQLI